MTVKQELIQIREQAAQIREVRKELESLLCNDPCEGCIFEDCDCLDCKKSLTSVM